ncbi:MAG: discoidin domain-containing protein [Phycisphaerae bacterium]|nr:discoidin domain-containing protein [Phycisphaerae bacterium]
MCKKSFVRASRVADFRSVARHPERPPSVIPASRVLWLVAFALGWMMIGFGGTAIGQVAGVDDPSDMADSSGDIKRIEAWVEDGKLNLTMTVHGVFAPSVAQTPAGMTNRYYYHWILDTDNDPATGYYNAEYEGNATGVKTPIGVDVVVQFGWRDGHTNGVYAYIALTEEALVEDYEYAIDGDTIHAIIPLADLGLTPDDIIALSAFQEGASNGWQIDWLESVVMPLTVVKATNPIPATGSDDIPRDVILGWKPGASAARHNVYFGTDWADVNDASVPTAQDLDVNSFDPGRLDFGQTYYWRVDEVNSAPDFTVFKGDVWNFTTEPFAYPSANIIVTTNAISEATQSIENILNGSGLDEADQHSTKSTDMWLGSAAGADPIWIQFEFDRVYKLHELWVWNYNVEFELVLGFGIKEVTIEYSADGVDWMSLGDMELTQATANSSYTHNTTVNFAGVAAKYVRLTVNGGWGAMAQYGLSEVRFYYIPAFAREPQPANGATEVAVEPALSWRAGREAVSHNVYLGTDPEALAPAATTQAASYAPDDLLFGNVYYWRVDEVNEAASPATWEGNLWSFTTQEYATIDDIEGYADDIDTGQAVFQTWIDGWTNNTGSTTGYAESPFAEKAIVHGGRQSMPVHYDNSAAPFYSEISRTWDSPQDWTGHSANTLVLHFYGPEDNAAETLYVAVEDSAGHVAVVAHPDPEALRVAAWQSWTVPYSELAGVNMARVETMYIGVGNRATPTAGGSGLLFIDDIGYGAPLAE